ncbi:phosphate ABC transporter ATP-binding protein [candidate division MSBL1 archaeon SCGC-AAA259I09]|uniref:Phosphate ABC transporter ATP-binding protein n=4 Tax=candidate division MSBL1 TaxID=215777 RepID=A0A133UW41_9EURY|nr:phosphate ABC transporter ATP-binding protein [candidate division MSBL1 archaeon SCGC-AAA259B11]KXA93030.1 phosphate ABC transporter ATP-binding protein [candidate division MSBL1 archaeon SCGC-AAA259E22]KXA95033.1 phosphate ABC transporter ATP-binding protein [candidate division MSBL1 archaeon SCGC-AAA259I07]KXA98417.1 phosphate ABC transporter ATP-binding protein [candidate division MSBL1 archaeon SCGC-AAA259I09]
MSPSREPMIEIKNLNAYYGDFRALKDITVKIPENRVTAIMGPSGCGKSTFIKCLNRMLETIEKARVEGEVIIGGTNIYDPKVDVLEIRKRVGMVFQEPNPLPMSIRENILYGPKIHGMNDGLDETLKGSLKAAGLWEEVKDRLDTSAFQLSGGQQQRLCIARALAVEPNVILMDEPTSSLDPVSSKKIEDLLTELRDIYGITVLVVTHNVHQAQRISDYTVFLYLGELLEHGSAEKVFENPEHDRTRKYIEGEL